MAREEKEDMMLQIFAKDGLSVRSTIINEVRCFVAKDFCPYLGFTESNMKKKFAKLSDYEKRVCRIPTPGGMQKMNLLTEAGVYDIICSCPKARQEGHVAYIFKHWIFNEVLPQIRRTGKYENQKLIEEIASLNCTMLDLNVKVDITKLSAWKIICDTFNVKYDTHKKSKHFWKVFSKIKRSGWISKDFNKNEAWHFTSLDNKKKSLEYVRANVKHNTLSKMGK